MTSLEMQRINKKPIWVFGTRKGLYYDDNSRYMFEYVIENCPDIDAVWVTKSPAVFELVKSLHLPVVTFGSSECDFYMDNAQVAFISVIQMDIDKSRLSKDTKVIQLWHGTPLKQNDISVFNEHYTFVSIASSLFLKEQALGPHETFDFQLTGYPRNDFLVNDAKPKFIDAETLGKLQNHKVITYLPTYSEIKDAEKVGDKRGCAYDIWHGLDFDVFESILVKNNAVFVFKLHALQSPSLGKTQEKMERSSRVLLLSPDDPACDVYEYLKFTDILITDYSSVYFDFLLLDRPILFACFDLVEYEENRRFRFDYASVTPGEKVYTWTSTIEAVENILLTDTDGYSEFRQEINEKFNFHKDAKSCERIVNITKQMCR